MYGPIKENDVWRSRYNHELQRLYNKPYIMKVITVEWLRWLGPPFYNAEAEPLQEVNST
jgi:hypothetical protein